MIKGIAGILPGGLMSPVSSSGGVPSVIQAKFVAAAAASGSITLAGTAAGNGLVVGVCGFGGSLASVAVTDNGAGGSSGWSAVGVGKTGLSGLYVVFFQKYGIVAGITSVTVNIGTGGNPVVAFCAEVNNITASSANGYADNAAATTQTTPALSNSTLNSIYFALMAVDTGSGAFSMVVTLPFAIFNANCQETNGSSFIASSFPDLIVSTTASRSCSWTIASADAVVGVAVFHS